jgi:hypothetical protein
MVNIVKVLSSEADKVKQRVVKILRYGKNGVQTGLEATPYGIDSNPIKDMVAIYLETGSRGDTVIVGYINKNQLAKPGELRLYATDKDGAQKFYTWMKDDGTYEIGGNTKHMARFEELETGFNTLKTDLNNLISAFNAHMHATAGTGPPVPPTPGSGIPAIASTASIASAKINEIKTL